MLNIFRDTRPERLASAIENDDTSALNKALGKADDALLGQPIRDGRHAAELAICHRRPQLLKLILAAGADAGSTDRDDRPLLELALMQPEQSLALISALLQAGADPNRRLPSGLPPLHACFDHCEPTQQMLHLSRLLQAGATIEATDQQGRTLLERALPDGRRELIHFLVHSGSPLPASAPADVEPDTWDYACRCHQDYCIRQRFLAP
ncbi:ankyrin repeat domain-containing protein [Marinobacterium aestuariivivens]|uniref:Ankyrin repeat domain-containing protein n=1 Tax=Marinobacterium aestuariivivens TaxID=1698799 RepID=A0ABW2A1S1_9GAMM